MNSVPKFKNILLLVDANMNQSRNTFKGYFYAHKHYLCQNEIKYSLRIDLSNVKINLQIKINTYDLKT